MQFLSHISHSQVFTSHKWRVGTVLAQMENNSIIVESSVGQHCCTSLNVENKYNNLKTQERWITLECSFWLAHRYMPFLDSDILLYSRFLFFSC